MALRWYEGMWLFDSAEAAKDWAGTVAVVENTLKKHGAQITKIEKWDDRKLAYDIGNCKRGTYLLSMFQAEPTAIQQMRHDFELIEPILRNLILEDEELPARVKEREELKKKREAEAAQAAAEGLPVEGERRYGDRPSRPDRPRRERPPVAPVPDFELPEDLR